MDLTKEIDRKLGSNDLDWANSAGCEGVKAEENKLVRPPPNSMRGSF